MKYNEISTLEEILGNIQDNDVFNEERKYCHYTDLNGFIGIFKPWIEDGRKECLIYASNLRYMNDKGEYTFGLNKITDMVNMKEINNHDKDTRKRIKQAIDNFNEESTGDYRNLYTISFCGHDDLLSQWKYYGKNCGIAINFDLDNCEWCWAEAKEGYKDSKNKFPKTKPFDNEDLYIKAAPIHVIYKNHETIITDFINKSKQIIGRQFVLSDFLKALIPVCKNDYFEEERESRVIFWPITEQNCETKVKYRTGRGLIIPYIECRLKSTNQDVLPVKSIIIGPGNEQNRIFNALIQIFEEKTLSNFFFDNNDEKKLSREKADLAESSKLFICDDDDMERIAYKTATGIVIKKSANPFTS